MYMYNCRRLQGYIFLGIRSHLKTTHTLYSDSNYLGNFANGFNMLTFIQIECLLFVNGYIE